MRALALFLGLLFAAGFEAMAQTDAPPCGSESVHVLAMGTNPEYAQGFEALRAHLSGSNRSLPSEQDVYTLPAVVHVVHRGSPVGVAENISDAQILSAIDGMNDDFRNRVSDSEGADTFIQFEMARRTPSGEPTNGIVRVNGSSVPGYAEHGISNGQVDDAADQTAVKSLTTWFGDDYINIFVVPEINGNDGEDGIQGFAYLGPTNDARDGVVVIYNAFGLVGELKPGRTLNKTITHEMGHHLSLYHTFSNTISCTSETNCEVQGDLVCDTPATIANTSGCTSPTCDGAQVENYMDYAQETCQNMFTAGQRDRMRACLESSRSSLLESWGGMAVTERDLTIAGLGNVGESTCLPSLTPSVIVTNFGTQTVTGFELTTSINGLPSFTTIHEESVSSGASVEVMLPELALAADTNELNLGVRLLGGGQDDFQDNDSLTRSIELVESDYWTMTLNTDTWANEISWRIENSEGEAIMSGDNYPVGMATYESSGCVPLGCHTLIMEDTNGDGLCSIDFGNDGVCDIGGSMSLTNAAGDVLVELDNTNNNYGYEGSWEVCASEVLEAEGCEDQNSNGFCDAAEVYGCQDVTACNFTPDAILDDGSCTFAEQYYDCEGNCLDDVDGDGVCDELEIAGCDSVAACNYDVSATDNDGSCTYPAEFYTCDGCVSDTDGDGVCDELEISGCQDIIASNYNPEATDPPASGEECFYEAGCTLEDACNYYPAATVAQNEECFWPETYYDCDGACLNDSDNDGICDELEIAGCTDESALNFDEDATDHDESCVWVGSNCEVSDALFEVVNELSILPFEPSEVTFGLDTTVNLVVALPAVVSEPASGNPFNAISFAIETIQGVPPGMNAESLPPTILAAGTACLALEGTPQQEGWFDLSIEGQLTVSLFGQPISLGEVSVTHPVFVGANPNPIPGCTYPWSVNFLSYATQDDGSCILAGCTDPSACNHQPLAQVDDGFCLYECFGCTYEGAINFEAAASRDDGSCEFDAAPLACSEDLNNDGHVGSSDLIALLAGLDNPCGSP